MERSRNLDLLGIAWMIWSGILAVVGVCIGLFAAGLGRVITSTPYDGGPAPGWPGLLFGGVGFAVGAAFLLMGVFGVIVGQALRQEQRWAMITALVLSILNLTNFPVGTIIAVWTFVAVLPILQGPRESRA